MPRYRQFTKARTLLAALVAVALTAGGCGSRPQFPGSILLALPDGSEIQVTLGSGVLSFANSTWDFYETGSATAFIRVRFGSDGEVTAFDNNTFVPEIFGPTILFDGQAHDTAQAGLAYVAAAYGAQTSDATGFSFVGRLYAYFAGVQVATAVITASGTFDADDPSMMTGTFDFESVVESSLPGIATGDETLSRSFRAERIE